MPDLREFFSDIEMTHLETVIRTLIPKTGELPDGVTGGVPEYLGKALTWHHRDTLDVYRRLLVEVNDIAQEKFGENVADLDATQRIEVLTLLERSSPREFRMVRNHCFEGYLSHPRWRDGKGKVTGVLLDNFK